MPCKASDDCDSFLMVVLLGRMDIMEQMREYYLCSKQLRPGSESYHDDQSCSIYFI
jgi:hypothetical protein